MEEPGDSIPCWERVVALDPDRAAAHLALGWALQDEGRFAECRTHYDMAIQLQPDSGTAYLNLGGLQEELGQMADAEASFRTALTMQPQFALPHARLATLLRSKLPEEDLAALEARLTDEKLAEGPRARLLFALAHALDGRGEYARAAECLAEATPWRWFKTAIGTKSTRRPITSASSTDSCGCLIPTCSLASMARARHRGGRYSCAACRVPAPP